MRKGKVVDVWIVLGAAVLLFVGAFFMYQRREDNDYAAVLSKTQTIAGDVQAVQDSQKDLTGQTIPMVAKLQGEVDQLTARVRELESRADTVKPETKSIHLNMEKPITFNVVYTPRPAPKPLIPEVPPQFKRMEPPPRYTPGQSRGGVKPLVRKRKSSTPMLDKAGVTRRSP